MHVLWCHVTGSLRCHAACLIGCLRNKCHTKCRPHPCWSPKCSRMHRRSTFHTRSMCSSSRSTTATHALLPPLIDWPNARSDTILVGQHYHRVRTQLALVWFICTGLHHVYVWCVGGNSSRANGCAPSCCMLVRFVRYPIARFITRFVCTWCKECALAVFAREQRGVVDKTGAKVQIVVH